MSDEYTGGIFHPDLPDGRAGATILIDGSGVRAQTAEGRAFTIPSDDLRIETGGHNGSMIFLRSRIEKELVIHTADRRILHELALLGNQDVDTAIATIRAGKSRRRLGCLTLLVALVGLVIGGWYGISVAAGAVATALPMSVDEQIGELAWEQMGPDQLHGTVADSQTLPLTTAFVRSTIQRLEPHCGRDDVTFEMHVVESEIVNAFALPGGIMVVYTGLIAAADDPSEVAGVIAHEMAHVTERHGLERMANTAGTVVVIQLLLGDAGGLLALAGELLTVAAINGYSRDQEREADREGVLMLHAAGIDPDGLATFFQRLQDEQGSDAPDALQWFSTHPDHQERIDRAREQIAALPPMEAQPLAVDWPAIRAEIQGQISTTP